MLRSQLSVLSDLKQYLGTESDFCSPTPEKRFAREPKLMNCPYCAVSTTRKRAKKTELGSTTFFCSVCHRTFHERTGTPFNYLEVPTAVVLLVVLWRLRYKLSLRDVAEMFLERGFVCTHETGRDWENVLRPWLHTNGGENDEVKPGDPGMWMRRPSRFLESGALSSGPLMLMAIWLMRD